MEREADRLWRSLAAGDGSQALGDIKCLVESISRIVLDIDGTPAAPFGGGHGRARTPDLRDEMVALALDLVVTPQILYAARWNRA